VAAWPPHRPPAAAYPAMTGLSAKPWPLYPTDGSGGQAEGDPLAGLPAAWV